jgi:NAD-dependent deacetylase
MIRRKRLVVLSGAGISVESGIAPFRGTGGLWNNEDLAKLATIEAWYESTAEVLEFYTQRRSYLAEVQPNSAHLLLAEMEKEFDVVILTQNVDDLHERAGSSCIVHLHGELTKVRPEDVYNKNDGFSEEEVINIGYSEIHLGDTGGKNHRQLRPHIVFFGEPVPKIEDAECEIACADILLIVGTSLQVYPAAGLYMHARPECEIYVIDPKKPKIPFTRPIHFIEEKATTGMEIFAHDIGFLTAK